MASLKELTVKIAADTKGLDAGINSAAAKLSAFGDKAISLGGTLSTSVTAPIAAMGAGILYTAGQFEAAMNRLQGISGVTGDAFTGLREKAKELGATTSFSASEAAQGMIALSQAGLSADQVMAGIGGTLQLAAAGGLELGEASGIAATAMAQFGLDASEVNRVANVMAATASSAFTDIQQLSQALKFGGQSANSAGMSFEQTAAALAILAQKGDAGSTSGERLRTVLGVLAGPSKGAADALASLGIAVADVNVEARGLPAVLDTLKAANIGTADAIKIFGVEAKDAARSLIEAGGSGFDEFTAKLTGTDAAAVQAGANMKGFEGAMKALQSATEGLGIAIAEAGLIDWATSLVTSFTELVRNLSTTSPELFRLGTIAAGVIAAAGPLLMLIGSLSSGLAAVGGSISTLLPLLGGASGLAGGFAAVAAAMTGPVGITVAAAAVVAGLGLVVTKFADTKKDADVTKMSAEELRQEIARLGGEVDKQAKGETWTAYITRLKETTLGLRETRDAQREHARGFEAISQVHGVAEASTAQLKATQKELAAELVAGRISAEEYRKKLDEARETYKETIGQKGIGGVIDALVNFKKEAPQAAAEAEKVSSSFTGVATDADNAKQKTYNLQDAIRIANAQFAHMENMARNAALAMSDDLDTAAVDLTASIADATAAMVFWGQTAADTWNSSAMQAATKTAEIEAAFSAMGIKTKAELDQAATDAAHNFDLIAGSGQASAQAIDQAWIKMLEARKAALIANGSDLGVEEQKTLDDLLRRQRTHATETKTVWDTWADGLKGVVEGLDIGGKIFAGDFAPGKWKETLKGIATDFLDVFLKPIKDGINDFIAGGLKDLSGALSNIGKQMSGIFTGGGDDATSTQRSNGGLSSILKGLGSGGGDPVTGAISAGIQLTDMLLSHFGRKRAEATANAIEENTRLHMLLFADYRASVGFFQNNELQEQTANLEYIVANGDEMKATLWSIRDILSGGISISGVSSSGVADMSDAVDAGMNRGVGGAGRTSRGSLLDMFDSLVGAAGFPSPSRSRTRTPQPGDTDSASIGAPMRSRMGMQPPSAEDIGESVRDALAARNPLAVVAAELGNPLAQLVTGSNFLPTAVSDQTAAIDAQTEAINTNDAEQTAAIQIASDTTNTRLSEIHATLHQMVTDLRAALNREIVLSIDGQEIARAVGAGQEALRATA